MRWCVFLMLALLTGCGAEDKRITYVCEEPLAKYLAQARENIANDYEVERSGQVLRSCPDKGYHRRYVFSFHPGAVVSKQAVAASVRASWCRDTGERKTDAELTSTTSALTFRFNYPWSTATGKYPRTEFRLNRSSMKGGFFEDLDWSCRLQEQASEAG